MQYKQDNVLYIHYLITITHSLCVQQYIIIIILTTLCIFTTLCIISTLVFMSIKSTK